MRERHIVTCFFHDGHKVLLFKRSPQVRTYAGRWAGVSGSLEQCAPREQVLREIDEELGLRPPDVKLLKEGTAFTVDDAAVGVRWIVYPFLATMRDHSSIRLNWEHTEWRWFPLEELAALDTVPKLKETWEHLWRAST